MDWIRYKLFGPSWSVDVYARALDVNTSIHDLAKLLANSNRQFGLERIDKKLIAESFDFKIDNQYKFMSFAKKEIEKAEDENRDAAWLKRYFNELWDLSKYGKRKTNKEQYSYLMNRILPTYARPHFGVWYRAKFRKVLPQGDNSTYELHGSVIDIAKKYINDNTALLKETTGRVGTDERELAPSGILYIREFGMPLTLKELSRITKLARKFDFEGWKSQMFREVLRKQDVNILDWQNEGLLKYYTRIRSTAETNRGDVGRDEITNYELLIKPDGSFILDRKKPEKRWRVSGEKKGNPGFQKKTLFDYYPEAAGLFSWISGKDIKVLSKPKGREKINNLYDFSNEVDIEKLDRFLIENYNMAIAFSRGDSDKMALVDLSIYNKEDVSIKALTNYFNREIADGYLTRKQAEKMYIDMKDESYKVKIANIAVHNAMKKVWPKYAGDEKGGPNVYKRLKIPFTPVTVNENMPQSRMFRFDPKKVNFQWKDGKP